MAQDIRALPVTVDVILLPVLDLARHLRCAILRCAGEYRFLVPLLAHVDRDAGDRHQQGQPGKPGQLDARAERDEHELSIDDEMPASRGLMGATEFCRFSVNCGAYKAIGHCLRLLKCRPWNRAKYDQSADCPSRRIEYTYHHLASRLLVLPSAE